MTIWQGRAMQVAARYGDQAPMAAVCCNACRTCTTTNLLALATGVGLGAVYAVGRFAKRLFSKRDQTPLRSDPGVRRSG